MKISVIIPVYNLESEITQCLDSIAMQDFDRSEYEIIVVLDSCTDNSGNVYTFTAKRLTKITDKNGNTMQFTYGTDNECNYNLISVTDGCGRKANLQYESGFLKRINLPDGTTITQENLATSYIDEISSSDGTSVKFEYSARDITRITDITGYQLNIVRNGNHYVRYAP